MEEVIKKLREQDKMTAKAREFAKDYFGEDFDSITEIGKDLVLLFAARFALSLEKEKQDK